MSRTGVNVNAFVIFLCSICLVTPYCCLGQSAFSVEGKVNDPNRNVLAHANVLLINLPDKYLVFSGVTDGAGYFCLSAPPGNYLIEISFLGFEKHLDSIRLDRNAQLIPITLYPKAMELKQVIVQAPSIRHNANGYSLYISGNQAYRGIDLNELLNMAPGIFSDDNSLSAYGQVVSKIYLNEREIHLSGQELADYLKTINSETVQKIDVIISSGVEDDSQSMGGRVLKISTRSIENGGMISMGSSVSLNK